MFQQQYRNDTTLSKYIWDIKEKYNKSTVLKWYIVKTIPSYSNITKRYLLYLHEKSEILHYPNSDDLLKKRSELIAKCHHANKYLLSNYKSKTSQKIIGSYQGIPWFPRSSHKIQRKLHCVKCGLFCPVRKFLLNAISANFRLRHTFAENFLTR